MVDAKLYSALVRHLSKHSKRPQAAIVIFTEMFAHLADDDNEVLLSRQQLADEVNIRPSVVSEVFGELEHIGAIYRRREGRAVRVYVNPKLGTHLKGAVRDRAQAAAPQLRLVVA